MSAPLIAPDDIKERINRNDVSTLSILADAAVACGDVLTAELLVGQLYALFDYRTEKPNRS